MWQIIMTVLSAGLFFSFVGVCVYIYGLKTCYSAYGPCWAKTPPYSFAYNPWIVVTVFTAMMLVPVTIELAEKDIISIIESRLSELLGDAQPTPTLRAELWDLIKKIKEEE